MPKWMRAGSTAAAVAVLLTGCAGSSEQPTAAESTASEDALVVYVGRSEELVGPLLEQFRQASGVEVAARYGDTAELAAQMLEEGDRTPADVFFSQDAGALQAVSEAGLLTPLPKGTLKKVPATYRAADGDWIGASGRARVLVYNEDLVQPDDIPDTVAELTDARWKGQVGIAPTNASFQSFVTAMRVTQGDAATQKWLDGLVANDVQRFENNVAIRDAVDAGQISVGLANHYYWFEKAAEVGAENLAVQNHFMAPGDPGTLVNVAGVGVTGAGAENPDAQAFVDFLLGERAQEYFATETSEYPLVASVERAEGLPPLAKVQGPDISLEQLADVAGTQQLLQQAGLL